MRRLLALALLLLPLAAAAQELPRGRIVERVPVQADPSLSYTLYLPTAYRPDRAWPILYIFDDRLDGAHAAEIFRAGAERHGYILASSDNTISDGPMEPNIKALRAMWADTHARFAVDDRRVYEAGFSGTVRFAIHMALTAPGSIAGVVASAAGFPPGAKPARDTPFLYYGGVGERDFNYYEVLQLDADLTALGLPRRVEVYPGPHQWMPPEAATRALGWMELQAMKKGLRAKDPALVQALWTEDLARARALEATDLLDAHRLWAGLPEDYRGLLDGEVLNEAALQASRLAASDAYKRERKIRQERRQRDEEYVAAAPRALAGSDLAQAIRDLRLHEIKKQAESADRQENLAARRLLNTVLVQTTFYLPRLYTEQGRHDRAVFVLSIAAEILPDDPNIWYQMAAAHARSGAKKRALDALRKAVEKGWSDLPRLESEAAFAGLRQDKAYREIVEGIAKKAPAG